jgi:hypothetical protein
MCEAFEWKIRVLPGDGSVVIIGKHSETEAWEEFQERSRPAPNVEGSTMPRARRIELLRDGKIAALVEYNS